MKFPPIDDTLARRSTRRFAIRMIISLAALAGAALFVTISRGTVIDCTRAKSVDCSVETNVAGFYSLYAERLQDVRTATADSRTESGHSEAIMLTTGKRTFHSAEWGYVAGDAAPEIEKSLNAFIASTGRSYHASNVESVPLIVAAALVLAGVVLFASAIRAR